VPAGNIVFKDSFKRNRHVRSVLFATVGGKNKNILPSGIVPSKTIWEIGE